MTKTFLIAYFVLISLFATSQTVDFTFQSTNGTFCNPATIQFTQTTTGGATSFIWNLGNGLKTTLANPVTSYVNAGTYTVKLIAIFPTGPLEISKTISISPVITPNIGFDRDYICQPGIINFSSASNGNIKSYDWDFGDATGVVSIPENTTNHNFTAFGSYTVVVKATDAGGCFGKDTIQIDVKKIPFTVTALPLSGCIPANVSFSVKDSLPLNSSASGYVWDFGDGTPVTNTSTGSANHPYISVGSFLPKVILTTNEGCVDTFNFPTPGYGTPPTNLTAYPKKTSVCGSETPEFVAKATGANRYSWNFGDGKTDVVKDTITTHKYVTLGIKTITVTPYFNGCAGTANSFQIEVTGIIAKLNYVLRNCPDLKTFVFYNYTEGNKTSILWDFGDGSDTSNISAPTHTFPASGQFITHFTARDSLSGCFDTLSIPIYTANPTLINPDTAICKNQKTTFTISDNYSNPNMTYTWNVMGKRVITVNIPTLTLSANILGSFNNYVIINNGGHYSSDGSDYCSDTIFLNHTILVKGPNLSFTMPKNICFGDLVDIVNNSKPFRPADSVSLWYWNYGNPLDGEKNDTIFQPAPVLYSAPGTYHVKLTGSDINGCTDSVAQVVTVNKLPFLHVSPGIDTLCSGQPDSLFAYHSDSVLWTPSTGLSCNTCDTVIAKPTATTQYYISAITPFNCSIQDSILIKVIQPFTAIAPLGSQYLCLNDQVTLDMNPKDKIIAWSPPAGLSSVNIYNPVARPKQSTTYTAKLTDSVGCFTSSANVNVFIKSNPTVDAGPDKVLPYDNPFTITPSYSSNVRSYLWTPSATLSCENCANPNGVAITTQTYTIMVTSDSGCVASDSIIVTIECKEANLLMPKAFTPNNDNLNDFFYPMTRGIKTILKFIIYNREGKVMYQASNFPPNIRSFGWDGTFKGKAQSGTGYVYIMEALCEQGEKLTKKGSVLLLR